MTDPQSEAPLRDGHVPEFMEAMNLWVRLTGVDGSRTSMSIRDWDVASMHRELHEAIALDPSDATAFLLLEGFRRDYFRKRTFTLDALIEDPQGTQAYVADVAALRDMLKHPDVVAIGAEFSAMMETALEAYRVDRDRVSALLSDHFRLGLLRRDALRSMRDLRVDAFLSGDPEPAGYRPVRHDQVHMFWNVNSLLRAACTMPSGVMMALVRDPDAYQSYFVFAVRNGGNLFLVSDVPDNAHPLQRYVQRRPDRRLEERASKNWFPYDLMGLRHDEEGEAYLAQMGEGAIVPYRATSTPLKAIRDLAPEEVVWSTMMLDLLAGRFFRDGYTAPALSYTGEMVRVRESLTGSPEAGMLPVAVTPGLQADPLTVAGLLSDTTAREAGVESRDAQGVNAWMVERYASQVPDDALNVVAAPGREFVLAAPGEEDGIRWNSRRGDRGGLPAVLPRVVEVAPRQHRWIGDPKRYVLHAFDATLFGTAERLQADRVFVARHNLASGIQRLADAEYAARQDKVKAWYAARVRANVDALLELACRGSAWIYSDDPDGEWHFVRPEGVRRSRTSVMNTYDLQDRNSSLEGLVQHVAVGGSLTSTRWTCAVNGTRASWKVMFSPRSYRDLMRLAGCERDELPDVLRNWRREREYIGNSNLQRLDPLDWALRDPWSDMSFNAGVYLSLRAMTALRRKHGISEVLGS